jgi:hypothetical protein
LIPVAEVFIAQICAAYALIGMINSRDLYVLGVDRSFRLPIAQAVKYKARLLLVQEPDKALQMYSEAQAMGPITSAIFVKIADAQAAKHHFKASASALTKAVRLQPQDVGLRLQKATMHLRMRETEAAAVELEDCTAYLEACIITCSLQVVSPCQFAVFSEPTCGSKVITNDIFDGSKTKGYVS